MSYGANGAKTHDVTHGASARGASAHDASDCGASHGSHGSHDYYSASSFLSSFLSFVRVNMNFTKLHRDLWLTYQAPNWLQQHPKLHLLQYQTCHHQACFQDRRHLLLRPKPNQDHGLLHQGRLVHLADRIAMHHSLAEVRDSPVAEMRRKAVEGRGILVDGVQVGRARCSGSGRGHTGTGLRVQGKHHSCSGAVHKAHWEEGRGSIRCSAAERVCDNLRRDCRSFLTCAGG